MNQLINRSNTKSHHTIRRPIVSEHQNKSKYNGIITDQCEQRGALYHIGLVKDHGGHLVNQPRLSHFEKC